MSFRPDPKGPRSIQEAIADLTETVAQLPPISPRAGKLTEMISDLQIYEKQRRAPHLLGRINRPA